MDQIPAPTDRRTFDIELRLHNTSDDEYQPYLWSLYRVPFSVVQRLIEDTGKPIDSLL